LLVAEFVASNRHKALIILVTPARFERAALRLGISDPKEYDISGAFPDMI
jgi:hypothetical protein